MKKVFVTITLVFISALAFGQGESSYKDKSGNNHLLGEINVEQLQNDTAYKQWFNSGYEEFSIANQEPKWINQLKDVEVEIYFGTWCGDSKNWVPKFIKMWDQLGLDRRKLKLIALYDMVEGESKYKQGPNGEEKGKNIHRVPTFIFTKSGTEIVRIVESPANDFQTDIAQIALGVPSKPNYKGASYLIDLINSKKMEEIKANEREHLLKVYSLIKGNPSELNTLGYVLLQSGRVEEALLTFYFNTIYFRYNPNVYDSYGEALAKDGQTARAIEMYEKVLLIDRSNTNAAEQLKLLKQK
jgi:tetratricopeptide (TPR) repeat protein